MYTIAFLKVRAFQLSKRHISTIHNLELCTPSHSSKYERFNCPNVISQQSTIYSYVHHRIPQSTSFSIVQTSYLNNPQFRVMYTIVFLKVQSMSFSIVQTSYLNNPQFRVMYTITFLKVRAFQLSKRHSSKYELFNCPNVISQQSTI